MSKEKLYKYIMLVSVLLMSVFIFFNWFVIKSDDSMMGNPLSAQSHSFMNITDMVNSNADSLAKMSSTGVAVAILIICAFLKYFCILASALGVWGIVRTLMYDKKSGFIASSQIIASTLMIMTAIIIIAINIVSSSAIGGMISSVPTIWYVIFSAFLVVSIVFGKLYSLEINGKADDTEV